MANAAFSVTLARYLDYRQRPDPMSVLLMLIGLLASVGGMGFVFYMLFTEGHAAFNTSSDMAWGAPIAFYLFFLLTSSGLSIFASLDTVFGMQVFHPVAKRAVFLSIACLVVGFCMLALELGHPFRLLWSVPTGMQIRSPLFWMGVFYSIDLMLLLVKFWLLHTEDWHGRLSHFIAVLSFVVCIFAPGTLGLVFGMMAMRPFWYSNIMPMYFILTGFTSAAAFLLFFTSLLPASSENTSLRPLYREILPRLFFVTLLATIGMRFGQIVTGLWTNVDGMDAAWLQLHEPLFWIDIIAGLLVPSILMAFQPIRRIPFVQFLAGSSFMIGIFCARLEFLIAGQRVPLFRGHWAGYVNYWPSTTEWMMAPAGFGMLLLIYGLGNWLLRLGAGPHDMIAAE